MVLIVSAEESLGVSICEKLYYMGIPSVRADASAPLTKINSRYDAVIFTEPFSSSDDRELVRGIKYMTLGAPAVAVLRSPERLREDERALFDKLLTPIASSLELKTALEECCRECDRQVPGSYRMLGIDASIELDDVYFYSLPIKTTRSEAMIIRTLLRFHPTPVDARVILSHAFRERRAPDAAAIRTHVCSINKKFSHISGRKIIESKDGEGYVVLLPEVATVRPAIKSN